MITERKFNKRLLLHILCGFIAVSTAQQNHALADEVTDELTLADTKVLSSKDMVELRAGFMDPSGYLVSFAVDVRTTIDGSLMFVRSLVLSIVNGQFVATDNSELIAGSLPAGATANLINDGKGVSITDQNGNTTLLNQTSQGTFANVILNAASNRNITQNMNIDIVLNNMQSIANTTVSGTGRQMAGFSALAQTARTHTSGLKF